MNHTDGEHDIEVLLWDPVPGGMYARYTHTICIFYQLMKRVRWFYGGYLSRAGLVEHAHHPTGTAADLSYAHVAEVFD
jgi:hypothetical protein